jgi:AraC family transcriptional regulator
MGTHAHLRIGSGPGPVKITLSERRPVRVACLPYMGPRGAPLEGFWRATVGAWLADHGLLDCARYAIALDDPHETPPDQCRYEACVELAPGLTVPDASESQIPGGLYAITCFKGTFAEIGANWTAFVTAAEAMSGSRLDPSRRAHARHPRGAFHDARIGVFACELCLPVSRM